MRRITLTLIGAVALLAFSGCREGSYVHAVGTCVARAGGYKISVKVWRDVGRSDAAGKSILLRACGEVNR